MSIINHTYHTPRYVIAKQLAAEATVAKRSSTKSIQNAVTLDCFAPLAMTAGIQTRGHVLFSVRMQQNLHTVVSNHYIRMQHMTAYGSKYSLHTVVK